jgi:hypothetical protein
MKFKVERDTLERLIFLIVAFIYLVLRSIFGGLLALLLGLLSLVIPFLLFWFGDELGAYAGFGHGRKITRPTPGFMIRGVGWLYLLYLLVRVLI